MRVHRAFPHVRSASILAAAVPAAFGLALAGAALPAPAAAVAASPGSLAQLVPSDSAQHPLTGVAPIPPKVRSVPIPDVSPAQRAHPRDGVAATPPGAGALVALVKRATVTGFSMVAVTWAPTVRPADPSVRLRTRYQGTWTGWTTLGVDRDGPSAAEDSSVRNGTTPYWVGHATGVEVAVYADGGTRPRRLSVDTIDPGTSGSDPTTAASRSDSAASARSGGAGGFPRLPTIVTRAQWGADESLGSTCWAPRYGTRFDAVIVHHTAGTNDYTRGESAAVVRGILAYHTISRGWCDIAYNFLIDRFGTIYEGRAGGIREPVRGAHAGNYNVDTTGISLMGNFDIAAPTGPMKRSLVDLIAWRLGTAYHGAYGHPFLYDGRFDRISGHRDVMQTACPGRYVYAWLPTLRSRVAAHLSGFHSRIETAWKAAGGGHGRLGPVRIGERLQGGGHWTRFAHGRMYKSRYGLFTFYAGPVLHYFVRSGGVGGDLGYPRSAVSSTAASGATARFAGGRVYWSSSSNVHSLRHGAILRRYLRTGATGGRLGFPTSSVHSIAGGKRAGFEAGFITYDRSTKKTTVTLR